MSFSAREWATTAARPEDHHHILKRIGLSTRKGGPADLDMESFCEILKDPASGLTDAALRGDHKQSVREAEILLSVYKQKAAITLPEKAFRFCFCVVHVDVVHPDGSQKRV